MSRTLYCETCREPVGTDAESPILSWRIDQEYSPQKEWQIKVWEDEGEWAFDSGKLDGKEREYVLPVKLKPHTDYKWKLFWKLEDETCGEECASFSTGMLSEDQWQGSYISGGTLYRKEFFIKDSVKKATIYYTGLGYVEGYLNGEKIGDKVLFPSYTVYGKTVEYTAEDITGSLQKGKNAVALMVGGHWPLDEKLRAKDVYSQAFYRGRCVAICQINICYESGEKEVIVTDQSWKTTDSPVICSSVFDGEAYDARMEKNGFSMPGFSDEEWKSAFLIKEPLGRLKYSYIPPIRVVGEMPAKKIWKCKNSWMVDFGQNFTGWVALKIKEKEGTEIKIRHGELIYEDGSLNVENLRFAKATDTYISNGKEAVYAPRFTYHGFRYAEITGISRELTEKDIIGKRVHTDNEETADFSCSDEKMNRIYQCMKWTMRSNMHSIPTDCCQRDERQGWMADAGVSSEFAVENFWLEGFYRKWFGDIQDTQSDEDGSLPLAGAPGWPRDTFIWKIGYHMAMRSLYLSTGNKEIVKENYPALQRYENYLHGTLVNGLLPYDFYNDWLAIEFANNLMIANAFLVDFYEALILFADVVDDANGKRLYETRLEDLKDAVNKEFYGKCMDNPLGTGYYGTCDTMAVAPSAMALSYDIAKKEWREKIIREMMFQICQSRGSVQYPTGILTSGILNQCLSDLGYDDVVYEFFKREDYPSLRFMLSKGATTIWERWQYLTHNEMNSHNHPALCSLGTWFFKGILGLRKLEAKKDGGAKAVFSPYIPEDMKYANGHIKSVWGTIYINWEKKDNDIWYDIEVPGEIEAVLILDGRKQAISPGKHHIHMQGKGES